jgi:hypothetical protein
VDAVVDLIVTEGSKRMAVQTRPYFIIHNGKEHMVEANQPAAAVQHVVGQSVTELRPARANEILAWTRAGKPIEVAGKKAAPSVDPIAAATMPEVATVPRDAKAMAFFSDWAGFDLTEGVANTTAASTAVSKYAGLQNGALDLMTFDELRQQAPEFAYAIIAEVVGVARDGDDEYRAALNDAEMRGGLATVRAALEEQPMPYATVIDAVMEHAGQ